MKNTVQVRRKSSIKPASLQPEIPKRPTPSLCDLRNELDLAVDTSSALTWLLCDVLHSSEGGKYSDNIQSGIISLVAQTNKRLRIAVENAQSALLVPHGASNEVVS
jgi:hypothetical protein